MTELVARSLSVRLGRNQALAGIDLALAPGRLTVVVGPNGAGKSTLLRALAGLLAPSSGSVLLSGVPVGRLRAAERARSVAYLPQNGQVAWPLPVAEVVALGRLPHGEAPGALPPEGREAVAAALAAVGLRGFEDRPATELSGGERARVLLARALATRAPAILADEPIAALDPRHELVVLDVLKAQARAGALVVAIMHNLTLAARFADEVVLLDRGRLRAHAPPAEVFTEARLAESFGIAAHVAREEGGLLVVADRPLPEP
ncbi:ABC transporter ATP-binding protein [Microvirga thermotolerans]|uniref:ATP-binding cassette domain-containing protein n=1 Tax=Microvirga thermotolerans TaxID=2651334 RepID=A0A5P9JTD3_9HYPH|nr:ABC transporter ATP-binding protein [Microvirga thermotolerans]QFU14886.1 ATP-binding cassette domain-containing protein [Microvirga thermotolerans]